MEIERGKVHPQKTWKQKTRFDPSGLSEYSPGSRLSTASSMYRSLSRRLTSRWTGRACFFGPKVISRRPFTMSNLYRPNFSGVIFSDWKMKVGEANGVRADDAGPGTL